MQRLIHSSMDDTTSSQRAPVVITLDENVRNALPIAGTQILDARKYGHSLWSRIIKIITIIPDGSRRAYLLKIASYGHNGRYMMAGEFESLKAIHKVVPSFAPEPHAWGHISNAKDETYFLLLEFREVGLQPPNPVQFTSDLAKLHERSVSPTGKFGFHVTTCNGKFTQMTDCWESSWAALYGKQLKHQIEHDKQHLGEWPLFHALCKLLLDKVIPRLLLPLQESGRLLKPCLLHGDLWDENTATDMMTGEPFAFDASSFYGHNEYEIGNWRALRRRLSDKVYVQNYKRRMPVSEPKAEWDDRNRLYSLKYDFSAALQMPGSNAREEVMENVTVLCQKYFPAESEQITNATTTMSYELDDDGDASSEISEDEEVEEEEEH